MKVLKDFTRIEDRLTGMISLPGIGDITIEFDLEDHSAGDDLNDIVAQAMSWLEGFNKSMLQEIKKEIATELTDSAYQATNYRPSDTDYVELERSLELIKICFFEDADTSLIFESKTEYPDMNIYCLLDESFSIADLFVDRK